MIAGAAAVLIAMQLTGCGGNGAGGDSGEVTASETDRTGSDGQGAIGEKVQGPGGVDGGRPESGNDTDGKTADRKTTGIQRTTDLSGKTAEYDETDLNADWVETASTVITCSGSNVEINGSGAAREGDVIRITSAGTYVLRGTYEGQVQIEAGKEDVVRLVMDGFYISNDSTSPVYGMQSARIVLILADGTENSVTDGAEYVFETADEDEPDAAIFSEDDLTINGTGNLTVKGNYSNAVRSRGDLKIISGNLDITAVKDGIKGKDSVSIKDGNLQIQSGQDGIKSSNEKDADKGYVIIEGGTITIYAGDDGIHAETWLTVSGGEIDIQESYEGLEGLKVNIDGGTIKIKSSDDGINAAGGDSGTEQDKGRGKMQNNPEAYIRITGGTVVVNADADGIDSNGSLYVEGGTTYINGPVSDGDSPLDYNGTAVIDGGVFAAVGSSGMMQGFSGESGQNSVLVYYSEQKKAGSEIKLTDDSGRELFAFIPEKEFSCILISMPELEQEKTYNLNTAGEEQEIVMDSVMTEAGERMAGGMGGGPGRRGGNGEDRAVGGAGNGEDGGGRGAGNREDRTGLGSGNVEEGAGMPQGGKAGGGGRPRGENRAEQRNPIGQSVEP